MTLEEWLHDLFPEGCQWSAFDVSQLVSGIDSNISREIKDPKIPFKWTNSELQWEPIVNALYNHRSANLNEQLGWVFLWLMVERTHGLWRLNNAGGRLLSLQKISNWRSAMLCMRSRLGIVDSWYVQQGGQAYSMWLYQAFQNPILFHASPKNRSWGLSGVSNRSALYNRILEVSESPLNTEHIELVDELIGGSVFSDEGLSELTELESHVRDLGRKQKKRWSGISPRALRTLIEELAHQAHQAQVINDFWHQNTPR